MGTKLPLCQRGTAPTQFSAHICCGQMAAWIKMSLGMELGLGQGDFVLDGDQALPPQKGGGAPQIFGPYLLRPNGWMDKAGTWHGGRPQPRRLCVRWGPSPLAPKRGGDPLPNFRPISIVAKRLDASRCHLVWMLTSAQGALCYMETQSSLPNKGSGAPCQFPAHFYCAQTAGCIKMPLGMEVGLSPGEFVLDGDPAPLPKRGAELPSQF